jgi:hypothetical protein
MAVNFPYIASGGPIVQLISHLRNSFPTSVDADTLKKLGLAPKNESYLINVLRFVGLIDADGKRTPDAERIFANADDRKFQEELSKLVRNAYKDLFNLHGDATWNLNSAALTTFFRQTDQSSAVVGSRQSTTFKTLAALSGFGETPNPRGKSSKPGKDIRGTQGKKQSRDTPSETQQPPSQQPKQEFQLNRLGLTVRIEINLPTSADEKTYDLIFKSIRRNLIDGNES